MANTQPGFVPELHIFLHHDIFLHFLIKQHDVIRLGVDFILGLGRRLDLQQILRHHGNHFQVQGLQVQKGTPPFVAHAHSGFCNRGGAGLNH